MKIFYPKGLADICAIPKSLIGRTLALGALAGISGGAVLGAWHILWRAIGVMAYGSGLVFESRGAAAAHALRSVAPGDCVFIELGGAIVRWAGGGMACGLHGV